MRNENTEKKRKKTYTIFKVVMALSKLYRRAMKISTTIEIPIATMMTGSIARLLPTHSEMKRIGFHEERTSV